MDCQQSKLIHVTLRNVWGNHIPDRFSCTANEHFTSCKVKESAERAEANVFKDEISSFYSASPQTATREYPWTCLSRNINEIFSINGHPSQEQSHRNSMAVKTHLLFKCYPTFYHKFYTLAWMLREKCFLCNGDLQTYCSYTAPLTTSPKILPLIGHLEKLRQDAPHRPVMESSTTSHEGPDRVPRRIPQA